MSTYAQPIITSCIYYSEAFEKLLQPSSIAQLMNSQKAFHQYLFDVAYFTLVAFTILEFHTLCSLLCGASKCSFLQCINPVSNVYLCWSTSCLFSKHSLGHSKTDCKLEKTNVKFLKYFFSQNFKCFELACISSLKKVQWVCFSMCVYSEQLETAQTFPLNPVFAEYIIELLFHIGSFITCCSALVFGALVNEWARLLKPNWACFEHTTFAHLFFNDVWIVKKTQFNSNGLDSHSSSF